MSKRRPLVNERLKSGGKTARDTIFRPERQNPMETNNQETMITIRVIEGEQVPEWVKTHTVWVETNCSVQTSTSEKIKS